VQSIVIIDRDGLIKDLNQAAELLLECPREKLLNEPFSKLFATPNKAQEVLDLSLSRGAARDVSVTLKSIAGRAINAYCNVAVCTSGKEIESIVVALRSQDTDPMMSQFAAIVESSTDGIISTTIDGVLTSWNKGAEEIFGFLKDEMLGTHISKVFTADHEHHIVDLMHSVLGGYSVEPFEIQHPRGNGQVALISVKFSKVLNSNKTVVGVSAICRDITAEKLRTQAVTAERDLMSYANTMLSQKSAELARQASQMEFMAELTGLLQVCESEEEVFFLLGQFAEKLFPGTSGYLFGTTPEGLMDPGSHWGESEEIAQAFKRSECFASRRIQPHVSAGTERCVHLAGSDGAFLCAPLVLREELLGTMCINWTSTQPISEGEALVSRLLGDAALALTNLRLRQRLKELSIRDPLTGLFNRRYMEEFFQQELIRSKRKNMSLSIVMFDCDHFKRFNDTHGHEAGDVVLKHIARIMRQNVRASDVTCRFGGEEFLIVMPDASIDVATDRAEAIRVATKTVMIKHNDVVLPEVTLSLGLACFPQHGQTMETIIKRADEALYQAKHEGRDRVIVAPVVPEQVTS
jgi:diguanylate cyclase (GGDEF)-like protein/PAS domain S-box-containing protein